MPKRIRESLLSLPMLRGLERSEIEHLAVGTMVLPGARGAIMFREGEACTGLYFVLKGQVKLCLQTEKGQERILRLVGEGESFGGVEIQQALSDVDTTLREMLSLGLIVSVETGTDNRLEA